MLLRVVLVSPLPLLPSVADGTVNVILRLLVNIYYSFDCLERLRPSLILVHDPLAKVEITKYRLCPYLDQLSKGTYFKANALYIKLGSTKLLEKLDP